jgi:hypothetical protein
MSQVEPPEGAASGHAARRVFGVILLVLGIGMTLVSGLCTAGMTIADLTSSGGGGGGEINLSGVQFIVGGPFILIGALMWWGGHRLAKAKKRMDANSAGGPPAETSS